MTEIDPEKLKLHKPELLDDLKLSEFVVSKAKECTMAGSTERFN